MTNFIRRVLYIAGFPIRLLFCLAVLSILALALLVVGLLGKFDAGDKIIVRNALASLRLLFWDQVYFSSPIQQSR